MKILVACVLAVAACGGGKPKPDQSLKNDGSDTGENCCCKSNPLTSEDGKPLYEMANRMECSTKNGACVPDVQCQKTDPKPE
jgi:hypothetical protein